MATPTSLPASWSAGQVLTAASLNNLRGAFRILQVNSTVKTDTFSTSSTSFVDVTGLSVSITPSSTTSKILVLSDSKINGRAGVVGLILRLMRDSTAIHIGDAAGSRTRASGFDAGGVDGVRSVLNINLDSPATTSAVTYKVQMLANSANNVYLNRGDTDTDASTIARYASSITVFEVSA